ncbi:hypothetical protein PHISCL_10499, partial [Aspergillus sclerotialis]
EGEDFAEKLARAGLADATAEEQEEVAAQEQTGDMTQGTGIWLMTPHPRFRTSFSSNDSSTSSTNTIRTFCLREQIIQDPTPSMSKGRQQEDNLRQHRRDLQEDEPKRRARHPIPVRRTRHERFGRW